MKSIPMHTESRQSLASASSKATTVGSLRPKAKSTIRCLEVRPNPFIRQAYEEMDAAAPIPWAESPPKVLPPAAPLGGAERGAGPTESSAANYLLQPRAVSPGPRGTSKGKRGTQGRDKSPPRRSMSPPVSIRHLLRSPRENAEFIKSHLPKDPSPKRPERDPSPKSWQRPLNGYGTHLRTVSEDGGYPRTTAGGMLKSGVGMQSRSSIQESQQPKSGDHPLLGGDWGDPRLSRRDRSPSLGSSTTTTTSRLSTLSMPVPEPHVEEIARKAASEAMTLISDLLRQPPPADWVKDAWTQAASRRAKGTGKTGKPLTPHVTPRSAFRV